MAIFVVGDLHLSLGGDKPMDVFVASPFLSKVQHGVHCAAVLLPGFLLFCERGTAGARQVIILA